LLTDSAFCSASRSEANLDTDFSQCLTIALVESIIVPSISKSIAEYCRMIGGPEKSSFWLSLDTGETGRCPCGRLDTSGSVRTAIIDSSIGVSDTF
jgi:hypothetical protein